LIFKGLGAKLAKAGSRKPNPAAAVGIGLSADDERFADAAHFYEFLLESCEKLFDNEIEVPLFEDQMRFMFGPRVTSDSSMIICPPRKVTYNTQEAYKIFTVDKVIGAIVKQVRETVLLSWILWLMVCQVQTIFTDAKSQDLYSLFKKEGQQPSEEVHYRETAAQILGDLEHLFRIEMARAVISEVSEYLLINGSCRVKLQLPHLNVFTVQLLGKDDPNQENPEIYIDRWKSYITSYTSVSSLDTIVHTTHRCATVGDTYKGLNEVQD
jgi:paired amphipathic helix protein Sin3a